MALRICFVTNEMHPVAPGGIGRLMYNFAQDNAAKHHGAEIHYLFPESELHHKAQLETHLKGLGHIHFCGELESSQRNFARALKFVRKDDWNFERIYNTSLQYMFGLQRVQRELGFGFDIIEFPDFGGWSFATIQAKACGLDFLNTRIAVRLHSSMGLICHYERFYHAPSEYLAAAFDQERYCLKHADIIAAHLQTIGDRNADHYSLGADWRAKIRIEFPPILLDEVLTAPAASPDDEPVFVFSSRLQPFKRPDMFINAGTRFLRLNPSVKAQFLLISYGWDEDYIGYLANLIPIEFSSRIVIKRNVSAAERREILGRGIIVIPSDYESLCLFAYESALLGRPVILGRHCEAFANGPRWQEGKNCLFFDDDFVGLAETMLKALSWAPTEPVNTQPDLPYWAAPAAGPAARPPEKASPTVRIIAMSDGNSRSLSDFCFRISRTRTEGAAVTVMLPNRRLAERTVFTAMIAGFGWNAAFCSGGKIRPAEIQRLVQDIDEDIVVFLPQEYDLYPDFIKIGLRCMARNPNLAIFGTHLFLADEEGVVNGLALFAGELPSLAMQRASVCPLACMIRRSHVLARPFDERARDLWLETFCRETVLAGGEAIIAPTASVICHTQPALMRSNRLVDATLRDDTGLAAGMVARLMSAGTNSGTATWVDNPSLVLAGDDLAAITRILPTELRSDWNPVTFKRDAGAALVHPLKHTLVVGHLQFNLRAKPLRVECLIKNAHRDNMGFEAAISLRQEPLSPDAIRGLQTHGIPKDEWTDWHFFTPESARPISVPSANIFRGPCHLYIATRVRPGADDHFAWAILESVKIF